MREEFGTISNVRFLGPEHVSMRDAEGNEIAAEKCYKCKENYATHSFIAIKYTVWICSECMSGENKI